MAETGKLKTLPAPKPGDSFGGASVRRKTVTSGHAKRPIKGLTQFNVKVRARTRERFEEFHRALEAKSGMTKGDLLEQMIEAFLQGGAKGEKPPSADAAAGRTEPLSVFATPELAQALSRRAGRLGWSLSATIENACAVAEEVEEARLNLGAAANDQGN